MTNLRYNFFWKKATNAKNYFNFVALASESAVYNPYLLSPQGFSMLKSKVYNPYKMLSPQGSSKLDKATKIGFSLMKIFGGQILSEKNHQFSKLTTIHKRTATQY